MPAVSTLPDTCVLVLSCPDCKGIVSAVSTLLTRHDATILESKQFNDALLDRFYMRVVFRADGARFPGLAELRERFAPLAAELRMSWRMESSTQKARVLIAVSKFGHCLLDLLHRWRAGLLPVEVVGVVSNHQTWQSTVEWHGIPFHHLPVSPDNKPAQEARLRELFGELRIDLLVLARYMQILSPQLCRDLAGRCINIHHSFLPSFKGARPYHQAYERGVKIIGATAHYVTEDLDEGPIIEQSVERVDHEHTPARFQEIGADLETIVLSRAVRWHVEHRVVVEGRRTVVLT